MSTEASPELRTRERPEVQTENNRVTARTVRIGDGTTETIYRVDGHDIGSRDALKAIIGGEQ